jgi:hypothetical protein
MKKLLTVLLVLVFVSGFAFADPIGLKVYIDGFAFGDVANENYEFSGVGGQAVITPGVQYDKSLGSIALTASLQDDIGFADPGTQNIRLALKGAYKLALSDTSTLTPYVYDRLWLKGGNDTFADTDADQIQDEIGLAIRFDQKFSFGTLYADVLIGLTIHTQDGKDLEIKSGTDQDIRVGYDSPGLYAYLAPRVIFTEDYRHAPDSVLDQIMFRVGYKKLGPINARVSVTLPTYEDGIEAAGLTIQPRATWAGIVPGLDAYVDFAIGNLGKKVAGDAADIAFKPTIGVSYAF